MKRFNWLLLALGVAGAPFPVLAAEEVKVGADDTGFIGITEDKGYLHVMHEGKSVKVQRVQDPDYELKGYFAKTGRKCPPFCLQPERADPHVETVGEVEVFQFMEKQIRDGSGLLIDARTPSWFQKGTIPGSINIPFTEFTKEPNDPASIKLLESFGAKPRGEVDMFTAKLEEWGVMESGLKTDKWDFTAAKDLMLWCNGPSCGQSPRAIKGLVHIGYPPSKIFYYRGGMQVWQLFGLTTVVPGN